MAFFEYQLIPFPLINFLFHSEILEPVVLPFILNHPQRDRIIFQQDGARCHNARITTLWLEQNLLIHCLVCSLQSQQDKRLNPPRQPFSFEWPPYRLFLLRSIAQFFTQIYINCFVSS